MYRSKSNKNRYNFLIDRGTYEDFSILCEELGLVRSKNLERHMKKFVEEHRAILVKLKRKRGKESSNE